MKPKTDAYRNPFAAAEAPLRGRILGATERFDDHPDITPAPDWKHLPTGERSVIPAGTLLQVRRAAGRLQTFWFDEDGSVEGPLDLAIHAGEEVRAGIRKMGRLRSRPAFAFGVLVTVAFAGFLLTVATDMAFWSPAVRTEFLATLLVAWAALVWLGSRTLRVSRRAVPARIEMSRPRRPLEGAAPRQPR
jgi:hypothetical protein